MLPDLWHDNSLSLREVAARLGPGVKFTSLHGYARALGLGDRTRSESDVRESKRRATFARTMAERDALPRPRLSDREVAALYAGRRYQDHPPTVTFGRVASVQAASYVGCATFDCTQARWAGT